MAMNYHILRKGFFIRWRMEKTKLILEKSCSLSKNLRRRLHISLVAMMRKWNELQNIDFN